MAEITSHVCESYHLDIPDGGAILTTNPGRPGQCWQVFLWEILFLCFSCPSQPFSGHARPRWPSASGEMTICRSTGTRPSHPGRFLPRAGPACHEAHGCSGRSNSLTQIHWQDEPSTQILSEKAMKCISLISVRGHVEIINTIINQCTESI